MAYFLVGDRSRFRCTCRNHYLDWSLEAYHHNGASSWWSTIPRWVLLLYATQFSILTCTSGEPIDCNPWLIRFYLQKPAFFLFKLIKTPPNRSKCKNLSGPSSVRSPTKTSCLLSGATDKDGSRRVNRVGRRSSLKGTLHRLNVVLV